MGFPPLAPCFDSAIGHIASRISGPMVGDTYESVSSGVPPDAGFASFLDTSSLAGKVYGAPAQIGSTGIVEDVPTEMREWGSPGKSPALPRPEALPQVSQSRIPRKRFSTQEESYTAIIPAFPKAGAPAPLACTASSNDDEVAALLPKMKRMRLRPSLGQLRLEREAEEIRAQGESFSTKEISVQVEPSHLTATLELRKSLPGEQVLAVSLNLNFPPQYPHKPPSIKQSAPSYPLACWVYEGGSIQLPRLLASNWSPAMGLQDILLDLISGPSDTMAAGLGASAAVSAGREVPILGKVSIPRCDSPSQNDLSSHSAKPSPTVTSTQDSIASSDPDVEMA